MAINFGGNTLFNSTRKHHSLFEYKAFPARRSGQYPFATQNRKTQRRKQLNLRDGGLLNTLCPRCENSPSSSPQSYEQYSRTLQTFTESNIPATENSSEHESCSSNPNPGTTQSTIISENDGTATGHQVNSNLKISERHDLVMMFTCRVCDTRSMKTACRESYEKGVVVVRCDGCNNLHLIADRLGWFGEPGSVEEFLAAHEEEVKKGSADTLNLTLEDLAGKKSLDV